VRELTPYLEPLLPLIAEVAEAEVEPTDAVDELSVVFHRERTQWAVSQLSVWLTRRPIVVQVEDAHWIDAASADLLSYVLARGADLPWLVISTRRPGDSGWAPATSCIRRGSTWSRWRPVPRARCSPSCGAMTRSLPT
jgi:hypothetical protein